MHEVSFSFDVDGMHCGGCVRRVRGVLEHIAGVTVTDVVVGKAAGQLDPDETDAAELLEALHKAGYPARVRDMSGPVTGGAPR